VCAIIFDHHFEGEIKVLKYLLLSLYAIAMAAIIVYVSFATPVVYHSHKTFVATGEMKCVFVLTNKGQESCSVLEKEHITRHESEWAE
jgi:hypothetical protein